MSPFLPLDTPIGGQFPVRSAIPASIPASVARAWASMGPARPLPHDPNEPLRRDPLMPFLSRLLPFFGGSLFRCAAAKSLRIFRVSTGNFLALHNFSAT